MVLFSILIIIAVAFCYLFIGKTGPAEDITWGMNFSQKFAQEMGLDWQETYLALLDDLDAKNLKVAVPWDLLETEKNEFNFDDLDWQVEQAEIRGAKIILAIGMKTPRWPECHVPGWAKYFSKEEQQEEILNMLTQIVLRYKESDVVAAWQVENEPFFPFGDCPWVDKNFLKKEVALVHFLDDSGRPVIITDSGEGSLWINAAAAGDKVGTTMYRKVWFSVPGFINKYLKIQNFGFYVDYPFPSVFYARKALFIEKIFHKEVICLELQAEPYGKELIYNSPLEEQEKTMNLEQFKNNIEYAKNTGLSEFYLWGGEWMYWMKTKQNDSSVWDEARKLF